MNKNRTPTMDITRISTLLVRDYVPDRLTLPKTMGLPFAPFAEEDKYIYKTIDLTNSEPLTYLKHRYKDLWLYVENNKPVFKHLQRNYNGFTDYKPPTFFWIEYLEFPSFVLYLQPEFGSSKKIYYLIYTEAYYHDKKTGQPDKENPVIYMGFTTEPMKATRFSFENIEWGDYININIPARTFFTNAKQREETYIISETGRGARRPLPPLK